MTHDAPMRTYWEERYDPANETVRIASHADLANGKSNIACAYNDTGEMHMLLRERPVPREGEVLIHVKATGICGSDVHFWKDGRIGNTRLTCEVGAGHESAGEVVALGPGVTGWSVGDRVAIEAGVPCGEPACDMCRSGDYKHCPHMVFHSSPPYHGTLTRFHAHPAAWLHRLPDSISFEEGALMEPLAVALAAVERAEIRLADQVVICGAGPVGLLNLLCAHAAGCCPIVVTDVVPSRLAFAKSLLPNVHTVVADPKNPEATAAEVRKLTGGGARVALECTGFESSVATAIYSMRPKGTVLIVGVGPAHSSYPFDHVSRYEIRLDFLFRYAHQYPKATRLLENGVIDVKPLVTHRFPLAQAPEAFNTAADFSQGAIKVQITD